MSEVYIILALSGRATLDREILVSYFMTCVFVPFCSLSKVERAHCAVTW